MAFELFGNGYIVSGDYKAMRVRPGMYGDGQWHLYNIRMIQARLVHWTRSNLSASRPWLQTTRSGRQTRALSKFAMTGAPGMDSPKTVRSSRLQ